MQRHSFTFDYDLAGIGTDIACRYYIVDGEIDAIEIGDWQLIELMRSDNRLSLVKAHGDLIGNIIWDCHKMIRQSLAWPINLAAALERDREADRRRRGVRRDTISSVG